MTTTTTIRPPLDRRGIVSLALIVASALIAAAFVVAALVNTHQPAAPAGLPGAAGVTTTAVTGTVTGQHSGALAATHHDGGRTERAGTGAASSPVPAGNRSWVREDGGRAES